MREKAIELAKKLKALADKGFQGEKENATEMLQKHLDRNGLTMGDLEDTERRIQIFNVIKDNDRIEQMSVFVQVVLMIMGKKIQVFGSNRSKTEAILDCTNAEKIEIEAAFNFYWSLYAREREVFRKAFIYKNNLLPFDAEPARDGDIDMKELRKVFSMMKNIDKGTYRKQIE